MAKRSCNLECVEGIKAGDDVLEFVGPVKIVLVDQSRSAYLRQICYAAAIVMAQMMMAIATVIVMFFSVSYTKESFMNGLHVLLCTIGLQTSILSGVLSLNKASGAAAPMKISDRRLEHVFVQSFGIGCAVSGIIVSLCYFPVNYYDFPAIFTLHSWLGISAAIAAVLGGTCGLCIYQCCGEMISTENLGSIRNCIYIVHRIFGILGILLSSACFVSGILKEAFIKWLPLHDIYYYMIMFCVFYTLVILYRPIKKFLI